VECNTDDLIPRVIDNGIGIPKQDQTKLFEPFHRAANTTGISGTGLGLSIVKSYVNAHHGRIEVESTEGAGTTFTVCIPVNS
jgi:signal transduction histidine kinase